MGEGNTTQYEQSCGSFYIVGQILDAMKNKQTYNNSTVIITADHGCGSSFNSANIDDKLSNPILLIKRPGESGEKIKISNVQAISTFNR